MIDFIGLELIEFHDILLKGIRIENDISLNLELEFLLWDEDKKDYIHKTLVFGELNHINPEKISIKGNSELEIYSFHYHLEDNLLHGKLICLTGFGKPESVKATVSVKGKGEKFTLTSQSENGTKRGI